MTIKENDLVRMVFFKKFSGVCVLDNKSEELILNTIKICGLKNDVIEKQVNFNVFSMGDRTIIIPLEKYDKYVLKADSLYKATVVEVKADDYIGTVKRNDGWYSFVINGDENK